jgi:micrococcal nuclease
VGLIIHRTVVESAKRRRRRPLGLVEFGLVAFVVLALGYSVWLVAGTAHAPAAYITASKAASSPVANLRMCYEGEKNTATKTCVVDGDTLWLHGTDYRLRDFDTPEPLTDICGGAAEVALAHKASARLLGLLNGNRWTIETFGTDNTGRRTLATIRIGGRDVGDILIDEHLARKWPDGEEFWCP